LDGVEWRVDYIISSSHLKNIDEPSVQLKLNVREHNTDNIIPVTFTVSADKFRVLLSGEFSDFPVRNCEEKLKGFCPA
jgi:hypothetical protein